MAAKQETKTNINTTISVTKDGRLKATRKTTKSKKSGKTFFLDDETLKTIERIAKDLNFNNSQVLALCVKFTSDRLDIEDATE